MPYAKNKIKVTVPHKSGFDKSHRNTGSLTCGTITPILCDELIPGSRVSVRLNLATQLPPLASDTYMNLKLKAEAFFCPSRLCCASFEDWFCDNAPYEFFEFNTKKTNAYPRVPFFTPTANLSTNFGPGTLSDYLGVKVSGNYVPGSINALPFIAYHLIWQEWYRNPRVQNPCFLRQLHAESSRSLACAPSTYFCTVSGSTSNAVPDLANDSTLADSTSVFALRQRNFGLDYFTGGRLTAQQGTAVSLNMPVQGAAVTVTDSDGNDQDVLEYDAGGIIPKTSFTIAALRAANSLQQFRERNNIPSPRLVDQVKTRYGAILSDGVAQRPICIGTAQYEVDSSGINQTGDVSASTQNPFNSVAAQYGRAYGSGSDFIISDFTANEPGYLFVMLTLVPEVTYASGTERMFKRYLTEGSITEMANPLLQNVGDQPVFDWELTDGAPTAIQGVFCYQDRYADFMFKPNSVHGLLRDGGSLESFVLQRSWFLPSGSSIPPTYSSAFLQIPKDYLDQVMAVSSGVSGLSAWYDCKIDYKVSMPLAEFSIPSLQDPAYEHGKPVVLVRNGQIF